MFCPKCGAQNPDNAMFCGSCGSSIGVQISPQGPAGGAYASAEAAYGTQAEQPAPTPAPAYGGGATVAPKPGISSKTVLIVLIAIAAVAVIAIIVGFVTCSGGGGGKVNLDSMVKDDPAKVASALEKLTYVKLGSSSDTFYTANDDMKSLMKDADEAFRNDSKKEMNDLTDDIKKQSPWAVALYEEEKDGTYKNLKQKDIADKDDPGRANYVTYRVLDDPKPEDVAKIAQEVASFDKLVICGDPTKNGKSLYGSNVVTIGYGTTADTITHVNCYKIGDGYRILVCTYNTKELDDSNIEDTTDNFFDDHEDYFDEAYTIGK